MIVRTARGSNVELRLNNSFGASASIIPRPGWGLLSAAGIPITQDAALGLPAVASVIRSPAELIASLPYIVYRVKGEVRDRDETSWQWRLLHNQPNPETDSYRFFYDLAISLEATQNAFIHKVKTSNRVIELRVLDPQRVRTDRDRDTDELYYEFRNFEGQTVELAADEVLHVRGFSTSPGSVVGTSLLELHRDPIGASIAMQRFEGDFFRNSGVPPFFFTGFANRQQAMDNRDLWSEEHSGPGNQHKPGFLHGTVDVKSLPISMSDAQFIETKRLSIEDACRIWNWPPRLLGIPGEATVNEDAWFSTFLKRCMLFRLRRIERAFAADPDLFPASSSLFGEFLTAALERVDFVSRMRAYKDAIQGGVMTPNEARKPENLPPHPGGDELQFPVVGGGAVNGTNPPDAPADSNGSGSARSIDELLIVQ